MLESVEKPWLRRADWATGRVRALEGDVAGIVVGWLFVSCWFTGLAGFAAILSRVGGNERGAWWILGGFAAAGLVPLAFVVGETRLRRRYGRAVFEMNPVPAAPGGVLQGSVVIPDAALRAGHVLANLACYRASEFSRMGPRLLWEREQLAEVLAGDGAARVPVRIAIAPGQPGTQGERRRGGVYWQLRLSGRDGFKGLQATFEVPVFVDMRLPAPSVALAASQDSPLPRPSASTIDVERLSGLTRFRFHFGPMAILFVVLLPLLSPALLLVLETLWAVVWIVAIVGFALVTHFMEPMAIEVGSEAVTLRRGLSGWFGAVRVPIQDVKRVSLEDCVNGFKQLKLETASDSLSASRVIGVMEAEWLQAEVRRAIAAAGGERS